MDIEAFRPFQIGDRWASMWSRSADAVPDVTRSPSPGRPGPARVSVMGTVGDRAVELRMSHAEFEQFAGRVREVAAQIAGGVSRSVAG